GIQFRERQWASRRPEYHDGGARVEIGTAVGPAGGRSDGTAGRFQLQAGMDTRGRTGKEVRPIGRGVTGPAFDLCRDPAAAWVEIGTTEGAGRDTGHRSRREADRKLTAGKYTRMA